MLLQLSDKAIILFAFLSVDDILSEPCHSFLDWSVFSKEQKICVVCTGECHQGMQSINLLMPHLRIRKRCQMECSPIHATFQK